jgi:serine/threonine protein kinase
VEQPPDRLVAGRYRLLRLLGSGGMGTVWRARDEVLGREVAVKEVTFPRGLSDADRAVLVERTRREARAAARLDHPSAVTVYDVVEQDGAPYLVMELVEARTLADVVREDGPLSPQRTAQVGLALLGALEAAHARGIVHRDVKPSNVMVRDDGRVVLTDFGIATSTGDSSITSTGLLLGSPAYIPPERARGKPPEPASDLWSLGATLFTAVEGRPPYSGDEPILTVTAVVTGEHEPFVAAGPLEPVLEGLLEKEPALRLDAAGARALLREVAERRPEAATRALPVPVPVRRRSRGRRPSTSARSATSSPRRPPRSGPRCSSHHLRPPPARGRRPRRPARRARPAGSRPSPSQRCCSPVAARPGR